MKNLLLIFSIATVLTACESKPEPGAEFKTTLLPLDSHARYNSSILTDIGEVEISPPKKQSAPGKYSSAQKKSSRSRFAQRSSNPPSQSVEPNNSPIPENETVAPSEGPGKAPDNNEISPAPVAKKKGWSDAAKGATIGAVGGAVAGAVISEKNRGKGAVIGGVVGAVGGYILGRNKDKKSGRVNLSM